MDLLNYLVQPYLSYNLGQIVLEVIAAITGMLSVYFAIKKNIMVYPIGIVSTTLYTYLLYDWQLYGDMFINAYYTIMSIYGWWKWLSIHDNTLDIHENPISNYKLKISTFLIGAFVGVFLIYLYKFQSIMAIPAVNYIDSLMTAIFLVAMYLMAKKKIENWHFWIIGDFLAIPLFIYKGYGITAVQYFIFLIMAIKGWIEWKNSDKL